MLLYQKILGRYTRIDKKDYFYIMKTIAIIDDDPIILEITRKRLILLEKISTVLIFRNITSFLNDSVEVDLIFLDINMTPISGVQGIPMIRSIYNETPIVILSSNENDDIILQTIKLGAVGYILKSDISSLNQKVLEAILDGGAVMTPTITKKIINSISEKSKILDNLTPREGQVAKHILKGLSYKMIAHELGISIDTVRMNVKNIYRKLNINSKAELFYSTKYSIDS
jgi:DNA-binding NarL/FixJ family response regulator